MAPIGSTLLAQGCGLRRLRGFVSLCHSYVYQDFLDFWVLNILEQKKENPSLIRSRNQAKNDTERSDRMPRYEDC